MACFPNKVESFLNEIPFEGNIKDNLFTRKANKYLDPNGLNLGFFQKFWDSKKIQIIDCIRECFISAPISNFLTKLFWYLLLKLKNPSSVKQLIPISLCSTIRKTLSKIIVSRIRPYLDKLISPFQEAFIQGRRAFDNIILA